MSSKRKHETDDGEMAEKRKVADLESPSVSALDPFNFIPFDCVDLILQHVKKKLIMSEVSKLWYDRVSSSSTVIRNLVFEYNHESMEAMSGFPHNPRRYQTVKVNQPFQFHEENFLSNLAPIIMFVRSISFEGNYDETCVEEFFEEVKNNISEQQNLSLEHITFIGDVRNMNLIMEKFAQMKDYESITFSDVKSNAFASAFKYLRANKLVLKNMRVERQAQEDFVYQGSIQHLVLQMTTIDDHSRNLILEHCYELREVTTEDCRSVSHNAARENLRNERIRFSAVGSQSLDITAVMPEEICDLIFDHLEDRNDLISLSEVSKTWFNFTKRHVEQKTRFKINSLVFTERSYPNIYAEYGPYFPLHNIFSLSAYLSEMTLEVQPEAFEHAKSLFNKFCLPRLTFLHIACHELSPLNDLRLPVTLTTLILTNFEWIQFLEVSETIFFKSLTQAAKLVELHFFDTLNMDGFFTEDVSRSFCFDLQSLTIPIYKSNADIEENFKNFLMSQKNSLSVLSLVTVSTFLIRKIFDNFKLAVFKFLKVTGPLEEIEKTKAMESLVDFQMPIIKGDDQINEIAPYFKLAPKMERLRIQRLTKKILEHLYQNFGFLEEIHYVEAINIKALKRYVQLMYESEVKARNNRLAIGSKSNEEFTRRKLVLEENDLAFAEYDEFVHQQIDERNNIAQ